MKTRFALAAAVLSATLAGCVKGPFLYSEKILGETLHSEVNREKLQVIAVLPENPERKFDHQVAARVMTTLEQLGWNVRTPQTVARKFTAISDMCKAEDAPNGVILVTWNYLSLWDCATQAVAYEVDGGYAGVDKMAERLTEIASKEAHR